MQSFKASLLLLSLAGFTHAAPPPTAMPLKSAGISTENLHRVVMERASKVLACVQATKTPGHYTAVLSVDERGRLNRTARLIDANGTSTGCDAFDGAMLQRGAGAQAVELTLDFDARPRGDAAGGWMLAVPETDGAPALSYMSNREGPIEVKLGGSPSEGPANAKVTVVLFSELECPFCLKSHDAWRQLRTTYAGRVRFVFKHRALPFHQQGVLGAKALAAAQAQGRFWEFADRAFEQKAASRDALKNLALGLQLDVARFEKDLDGEATQQALAADDDEAKRLGVKGVPSWFIAGEEVVGAQPYETLAKKVDAALARARH